MKRIMLLALIVLLVGAVSVSMGQVKTMLGAKVGLNLGNVSMDPDPFAGTQVSKSSRTGIEGGAALELMFHPLPIGLEADFMYAMGGTVLEGPGGKITEKINAVLIPVLFKGKIPTRSPVTPYGYIGPALAIIVTATDAYELTGQAAQDVDIKDEITSTDFEILFGAGVEFKVIRELALTFDIRYALGLTDVNKANPGDPTIKSRNLTFLVGALFAL